MSRRILVDVAPLRESRQFRLLFTGELISYLGTQLTAVAAPFQVFVLTRSSLAVGLLGLAQLVPLIAGSLWGGALADAHDRRRVLLVAQVLLGLTSLGLALNASLDSPSLVAIYVLTALHAGFSGLDSPARAAAIPSLVRAEQLTSALALNQLLWQVGAVVGPAIAGLLIARVGLGFTYVLDVVSFAVAFGAVALMRPVLPRGGGTRAGRGALLEGLRFLRRARIIQAAELIDLNAMVFGAPRALFPALGTTVFGGGAAAVGLLYAAPGAGAALGAASSGWANRVERQGRAVIIAVVVWGLAIAAFGLSPWFWLALVLLAVAGAADVVSAVFRNTILQLSTPDRLRGRISAVHIAVVTGGPRLGDVESGAVAALTSPQFSVVSGGVVCMAGAGVVSRLYPELRRWLRRDHLVVRDLSSAEADDPGPPDEVDG